MSSNYAAALPGQEGSGASKAETGRAGAGLDMDPGGLWYLPAWILNGNLMEINSFIPSLFANFPHWLSQPVVS